MVTFLLVSLAGMASAAVGDTSITGIVYDANTFAPVIGANVEITCAGNVLSTTSQIGGQYGAVFHNNKYLGDVKVEKVHERMAAAGFLSSETKDSISEGDKVVQKAK